MSIITSVYKSGIFLMAVSHIIHQQMSNAEMKLRIHHIYMSWLTNEASLMATAQHVCSCLSIQLSMSLRLIMKHLLIEPWCKATAICQNSCRRMNEGLSATYSCACEESVRLQVDKSVERDSTISLLQLSNCRLLTHISVRMFPFTALLPFLAQQKCPTLFQFVVHRTFLPAVAMSPRSTFCMNNRYSSSSSPW